METPSEIPSSNELVRPPSLTDQWAGRINELLAKSQACIDLGRDKLAEITAAALIHKRQLAQGAVLAGVSLFAACEMLAPAAAYAQTPEPTATPTPLVIHVESEKPTSQVVVKPITPTPSAQVEATPLPSPAETSPAPTKPAAVEQEAAQSLAISGYVEADPENPSLETVSLVFPKDMPLSTEDEYLSVALNLKSDTPITKLKFPISKWTGNEAFDGVTIEVNDAAVPSTYTRAGEQLLLTAQNKGFKFSNPEIFEQITIANGQLPDGRQRIAFFFPAEDIAYTDAQGNPHTFNIARGFLEQGGQFSLGRRGDLPPGTVLGPIALKAEDSSISLGKKDYQVPDFEINWQKPATIASEKPALADAAKTETPNKWLKNWAPNEEVSLKTWWDDMVAQGYIRVDSLARQYAGEEINKMVNTGYLVPNPQDYAHHGKGSYIAMCKSQLDELVNKGKGHVTVDPRAYENIPGGANCQLFAK